jgi:hypothetical protein
VDWFLADGVDEGEFSGMQMDAPMGIRALASVFKITLDRMANGL